MTTLKNLVRPIHADPTTSMVLPNGATVEFVLITPAMARDWLAASNKRNRRLNASTVARYRRDLEHDAWMFTGDPIRFDWNGNLSDGQHRLTMIAESGVGMPCLVIRGLDPRAQDVIDGNRRRSVKDALDIRGQEGTATTAGAATLVAAYIGGYLKTSQSSITSKFTNAELIELVEGDPSIAAAAAKGRHYYGAGFPSTPSVLSFCYWLFSNIDDEAAQDFFGSVTNMTTRGPGDPRHTLYRKLQQDREQRVPVRQVEHAFLIVRAWNAYRSGEDLQKMQTASRGVPIAFPEPI